MPETLLDTSLPITVLDPDETGDVTPLLGTTETLRVTLVLRNGDHLYGRITELITDAAERVKWVGFVRETDLTPEKGLLVERIRFEAIDMISRREGAPLDAAPALAAVPSGTVRIPVPNFTQALIGRRAAPLMLGQTRPAGVIQDIKRGMDPAGDRGYWDVTIRGDDERDRVYVIADSADSGLLVAEQ